MKKGLFITFEGPEGAGKTTIIEMLEKALKDKQYNVMKTREPGGIHIAEKIREVILNREHTEMDERTEALLYAAARRQHLVEKVIPALESGRIVLCDRFIDSSLAYQGHARGIGIDEVFKINEFAISETMPDVTVYFDIPPEEGLRRISQHEEREVNRLDLENIQFHLRVQEGYILLQERFPERIKKINANQPIEQVFQDALDLIHTYI